MEARAPNRSYVADRSDLYVLTDPKSIPLETHTPPQHLILRARRISTASRLRGERGSGP